ncbi:MAG: AAA family ATPase [Lachnospiraceae bacterium]|nr:AAA family ATPase [Lachnospiraceae bacterium]
MKDFQMGYNVSNDDREGLGAAIMELRRTIYDELVKWKEKNTGRVLEVEGARQVGKTYILRKFARENFSHVIYISMADVSGNQFIQCLDKAEEWEPGMPRKEETIHQALQLYDSEFTDDKNTVILIDEIQESSRVYNLIRVLARNFDCYVIVTGSYLGRLLDKEFFLPAGDLDSLTMETLTFEEFADAFGKGELYRHISLYGQSDREAYQELHKYYDIYQRIGGYPAVVNTYLETESLEECESVLWRLMSLFVNESKRYFTEIVDVDVFEKLFNGIAITMIREKLGVRDLVEEISKIVYQSESGRITKKMMNHAISWLQASHIIGYAAKAVDCDFLNIKENSRFYFLDMGIAHYFLSQTGVEDDVMKGILAENFVYLAIRRHLKKDIAGSEPWFGYYEKTKGELDFFVRSKRNHKNYGVEVKSTDAQAKTARALYAAGKLDKLYYLKGESYGGIAEDENVVTVPLYLADRIRFE